MKAFSVLLALLCSSDVSLSFLTSPYPSEVNAAAIDSRFPFSFAFGTKNKKNKSRLFYYGDYDDNYFHPDSGGDDSNHLHLVSNTLRGGAGDLSESNKDYGSLSSLSVSELKKLLNDRGVDYRDCLEKRDLVERLANTRGSAPSSYLSPGYNDGGSGDGLSSEENRVVNTFTRSSPSVAFIQTTAQQQTIQRDFSLKGTEVPIGTGSGFLWDDKGHVITNYHVIASATKMKNPTIKVKLQGMPPLTAKIVGYEPEKDLAVLKIPSNNLPTPLAIGSSNDLQVGQNVLAIGNPFGLDFTLTTGVVSALGRDVDGVGGRPIKGCIQSDASINPGNSGGPLLDSRGRLIGVNMAIYSPSGASAGIGFAIPVDTVRRVVNQIIRYGKVIRPSLGLNVAEDRVVKSIEMQLRKELNGVLVVEILKGSPAEKAGLKASSLRPDGTIVLGDLITEVNGEKVVSVEDLLSAIETRAEGETVVVKIWRECNKNKAEIIQVKLTTSDKLKRVGGINNSAGKKSSFNSVGSKNAWQ